MMSMAKPVGLPLSSRLYCGGHDRGIPAITSRGSCGEPFVGLANANKAINKKQQDGNGLTHLEANFSIAELMWLAGVPGPLGMSDLIVLAY
jgi:hypothetical protein